MSKDVPKQLVLSREAAIWAAKGLTSCTSRNEGLTAEVARLVPQDSVSAGLVSEVFVRFPMWFGAAIESDIRKTAFSEQAQMWVIPGDVTDRRPHWFFHTKVPAMTRVPFQWRAVIQRDAPLQIFTDRCMVGQNGCLPFAPGIAEALVHAAQLYAVEGRRDPEQGSS